MTKDAIVTVRIDSTLNRRLEALARATKRSKSYLAAEALQSYVESEAQFVAAIEEGLRDIEADNVVNHDTVVADFRRRKRRR